MAQGRAWQRPVREESVLKSSGVGLRGLEGSNRAYLRLRGRRHRQLAIEWVRIEWVLKVKKEIPVYMEIQHIG